MIEECYMTLYRVHSHYHEIIMYQHINMYSKIFFEKQMFMIS